MGHLEILSYSFCDSRVGVAESESSTTPNTKPRGGKLARRARSFKEDFLEILSQMRSPGGGNAQRAGSPHSPKTRTSHKVASIDTVDGAMEKNPLRDLDLHVKQVCHFGITVSMTLKIHCCLHWCYKLQHVRHPLWSVKSKNLVVCFLLGNSPASEFYIPTFRNTLSVTSL